MSNNIDLGPNPVGTPPTPEQAENILTVLGAAPLVGDKDIEITDETKGIILYDGTNRWKITISTNGELTTSQL